MKCYEWLANVAALVLLFPALVLVLAIGMLLWKGDDNGGKRVRKDAPGTDENFDRGAAQTQDQAAVLPPHRRESISMADDVSGNHGRKLADVRRGPRILPGVGAEMTLTEISAWWIEWNKCVREAKNAPKNLDWQWRGARAQMKLITAQALYWSEVSPQ